MQGDAPRLDRGHKRWKVLASLKEPCRPEDGSPLINQLLHNRGIDGPELVDAFLNADQRLTPDPFRLPDMPQAVSRIHEALLRGEKITIYGDFDTDGLTGAAILVQGMAALGARVTPYIPSRFEEGHGLKISALENMKDQGVSLVITVDCGINDNEAADFARSAGLDLIITDHHTLTAPVPDALAVINPKRPDSSYPFDGLCGAGVAYRVLEAIYRSTGRSADSYLDLVALGTVTDMVPLLAENRFLVKKGTELLKNSRRPGLRELIRVSGLDGSKIEAEDIAWVLGPRLNAAGRVEHASLSYNLLTTASVEEAAKLARALEEKNARRQALTEEVLATARDQAAAMLERSKILIVSSPHYHSGVHGLVANRLVDEFYRPSIVMETRDGKGHGSGRSIPEFNMIEALMECRDLLSRYGGHPGAAGFALAEENVPRFIEALQEIAGRQLESVDLRPEIVIDIEMPLSVYLGKNYRTIRKLAPFGKGNPEPVFLSRGVQVIDSRVLGNGGSHLKCKLRAGNAVWTAIGFDLGELAGEITRSIDIVYHLHIDRWCNQEMIELHLLDFRPSASPPLKKGD
ncbi:MAG: single-stranded-DNA-specific exonuclease RecJ [Chloroflexi bacterium]|nr:single-stranded-DNA-specific exonuclease RecJ [Chloroflexota bacterium]